MARAILARDWGKCGSAEDNTICVPARGNNVETDAEAEMTEAAGDTGLGSLRAEEVKGAVTGAKPGVERWPVVVMVALISGEGLVGINFFTTMRHDEREEK